MVNYWGKVGLWWLTKGFLTDRGQVTMATAPTDVMEPDVGDDVGDDDAATDVATGGKGRGRRKAEDDPREAFGFPASMLNDKGKIKTWESDCGYEFGTGEEGNLPVRRADCESDEAFYGYRIAVKQDKVDILLEEIETMKRVRDQTSSINNPVDRETAKRALILHKRIKKEMAELAKAGIDWDELIGKSEDGV
jgi:hypothetical protein